MLQFRWKFLAILFATSLLLPAARAADEKWNVETLVQDLAQPVGLAVQPGTENLFVSEAATGKIIAFAPAKPEARRVAIEGFPLPADAKETDPAKRRGVAGLSFLNAQVLAVAFAQANNTPAVSVYQLLEPGETELKTLQFDAAKQLLAPTPAQTDEKSSTPDAAGTGQYFGVTISPFSPPALFVTNPGSNRGWLFKAELRGQSSLYDLKPLMATKVTPLAIAVNQRGVLVVATSAAQGKSPESNLSFYNAKTGGLIASFKAPVSDLLSLAYSPSSGRLYAASSPRVKSDAAPGIYRLDGATVENRAGMTAVRVAAIERPTALAFTLGNALYATALGDASTEAKEGDAKSDDSAKGTLIKITGEL